MFIKEHFSVWNLYISDFESNELNLQIVADVSLMLCKMVLIESYCM
jgi:hypothetical protein